MSAPGVLRVHARIAILAPLLVTLCGCIAPQIVFEGGIDRIELDRFPPNTVGIEIAVGRDGAKLRGVFVPGPDARAPVLLQFMASGKSITCDLYDPLQPGILRDVRRSGLALLVVDYRGVGASDGTRDVDNLRSDARAAWEEALRRTGDPRRIVLRGASLGGLALATLLKDGVEPAAVVIAAPILDETINENLLDRSVWGWFAWILDACLFRRGVNVDFVQELTQCHAPRLVLLGAADDLLGADGRALLIPALRESGATVLVESELGHSDGVDAGNKFLPGEAELYGRLFPGTAHRR